MAQTFSKVPPASPFEGVEYSSIAFSDVDGDGDDDLLITGQNILFEQTTKLYINDDGNFSEVLDTPFEGTENGSVAFSDVDGDGDNDLLITGLTQTNKKIAQLYANNGLTSSRDNLLDASRVEFTLYPNPVNADNFNISIDSKRPGLVTIKVFDLSGRLLIHQKKGLVIGDQALPVNITSLTKGSYFVQLEDGRSIGIRILLVQ